MDEPGVYAWRNPWFRWSLITLIGFSFVSLLIGFVWLPSAQRDYSAQGLWASICRAAGVPARWGDDSKNAKAGPQATEVVLDRAMASDGTKEAVGRGATLALNCTMCHGAQGMSATNSPNLAGQYPEVIIKQLHDYRSGRRSNPIDAVDHPQSSGQGDR